ncbi:hypothetical protein DT73_03120 [Mangrovibacter sp. MFB070]|nr:hypothetical protein DT73_03120 [Mangrovibacter sp. MFB070]
MEGKRVFHGEFLKVINNFHQQTIPFFAGYASVAVLAERMFSIGLQILVILIAMTVFLLFFPPTATAVVGICH